MFVSGAGGGLRGGTNQSQAGQALELGGIGGKPCPKARDPYSWEISGGFGGGGGACMAGGGGGGYTGGNVSQTDNREHNGQGGSSYIGPDGIDPIFEPGTNHDDGEVEIAFVLDCPCEFMCIYQNYQKKQFKCYCAPNFILAEDGLHCIDPRRFTLSSPSTKLPVSRLVASVIGGLVVVIIIIVFIFCIVHRFSKKKLEAVRLDMLSSPDYQLDRLRSNAGTPGLLTAYNPNYDFGGSKCTLQDLREIQRDHLTLVRALGQGAFGEVYQGYLSHVQRDTSDLPVAVKTLPALCTNQAEMDFLMEALIMSKFNHSNIVRFIGVCFEKHPRFIVLELLEGGDLKSFLRESRPKPRQPSRVTMVDLVELSLDIAQGCLYLEENHFIHRDIAARNCLLTKKGPGRVAKIADFGMARDIYRADYYRKGGKAMLPVKWMPPEAFLDGIFTLKTDIWSFGILLWEVFSLGYMPYPGRGNQEVMQLVTAGGRLDPPKNCPSPVYHIMGLCWHGIPERRPNFSTMIEKLQACLQDPGVIHSPLPVFHRPPSVERDTTIMRPRDPDRMVLTVEPPRKYVEPDSPNSLMQLIGPQSPDYREGMATEPSMHQLKKANGNGSAESLDKLLLHEDKLTGSPQYGNVFSYDSFISDACLSPPGGRADEVQFATAKDQACDKSGKQQQAEDRMSADGASRCNDSDSELSCSGPGRVNTMDSGKGSLDSFPREMGSAARLTLEGGNYVPGDSATLPSSIARSRPSPKKPVTERSSLLSLDKSHPKLQPCRSGDTLATTSSPSLNMRTSDDGKSLYVNIPAQTDSVDGDFPHRLNRWSGDSSDGEQMAVTASSSDPGDSGVVIDLRDGAATRLCAEKDDC
ncbi:hypothetical protein NP493_44g04010 [Ridgeia piscesae]|uniref:Tyrosine-protein kinase receptor n=1 Tax=Ridgeia piscesae TaxID=27915 RepID=A0AAD9PBR7_RIDPI|nr:hypothetical protein NP493_44g04010 [Ridgeia piscesae]